MRYIFAFLIIVFSVETYSQQSSDTINIIESINDSIDISQNFYNIFDSLTKFNHPADYAYQNWKTQKIRYQHDSENISYDSIPLQLIDSVKGKYYHHPFLGKITSHFGYRRFRFHYGTDIDLVTGDSVVAAFDGMVRVTTYHRGFGKVIVLRHCNGLETVYAHLSKILVDSNDVVKAGQLLAYGGNTGRSTGSHLHFEVRYLGRAIDPESIVNFSTGELLSSKLIITENSFKYLKRLAANKNAKYHYVRSGDTLSAIARRYHTRISKLCYYNGIKETVILQIGQKLRVR